MRKTLFDFLRDTFLFSGISDEEMSLMCKKHNFITEDYKKGDEIYSARAFEHRLYFVMRGECRVERMRLNGCTVPLSTVERYGSFGILSAFEKTNEFPTRIVAVRNTRVIYIPEGDLKELINSYPKIAENVISFLCGRIVFLNEKIAAYTGADTEEKVAQHLLRVSAALGTDEFPLNAQSVARAVDIGRASVYRALDSLVRSGCITYADRKIKIINPDGMKGIHR